MDSMGVTGMSPLTMMSMHEQYPWMKEKKSARKQMQGRMHQSWRNVRFYCYMYVTISIVWTMPTEVVTHWSIWCFGSFAMML